MRIQTQSSSVLGQRDWDITTEHIIGGDFHQIARDADNPHNSDNFTIKNNNDSLGNPPAELCNALSPLYDGGYATILTPKVPYIERLRERSRYVKQGVLFVEMHIKMRSFNKR